MGVKIVTNLMRTSYEGQNTILGIMGDVLV